MNPFHSPEYDSFFFAWSSEDVQAAKNPADAAFILYSKYNVPKSIIQAVVDNSGAAPAAPVTPVGGGRGLLGLFPSYQNIQNSDWVQKCTLGNLVKEKVIQGDNIRVINGNKRKL